MLIVNNEQCTYKFNTEEENQLTAFVHSIKKVHLLKDVTAISTSFNIKFNNDGIKYNGKPPSENDKSAFLHKIRPIILRKEKTYFEKITNILVQNISCESLKLYVKKSKKKFFLEDKPISFNIGDISIYDESTITLWLNAYEYHNDIEKVKELEPILKTIGFKTFESFMMNIIIFKFNIAQKLAQIIEALIDKTKTHNLTLQDI